jgi:hypothetical protein
VRVRCVDNTVLKENIFLDDYSHDSLGSLAIRCDDRIFVSPMRLEIKSINYDSSLQFSLRMIDDGDVYQGQDKCILVREQLSVAYF